MYVYRARKARKTDHELRAKLGKKQELSSFIALSGVSYMNQVML